MNHTMEQVRNTDGKTVDVVSRNHWDMTWDKVTRWFIYVGIVYIVGGAIVYTRLTDQVNTNTATLTAEHTGINRVLDATAAIQTQLDSLRIEMRHLTPRSDR